MIELTMAGEVRLGSATAGADGLTLALVEYEANRPDWDDYLCLDAEVSSTGFTGQTQFWVSRHVFDGFLSDLQAFERSLQGNLAIRCGWGEDVLFSLEFFPYDRAGHLGARVEVAADRVSRQRSLNRVSVELEVEPQAVTEFLASLRATIPS
jgi:hypothetical protein